VIDPAVLGTTSTMISASCNGICDGSITTNPTGGVAPYAFIWSDGQTSQTASNLCAGTYSVVVSDFNNCTVYDTVIVTEPNILNDSTIVTGPTCGLCDGSATSTPFGGIGAFTFVWTDPISGLILQTTTSQASSTIVGLCAGTVDLEITDLGSGCISNHTVIVNNSTGPNVVITSTDETCSSTCDGTALASATSGTTPYTFSWDSTPIQVDSNATNLCAGFYTVTVTDAVGCITTDTVTINTNTLNLSITNVIPETCFGDCDGSATVISSSGVNPFTYLWNPTNQSTQTASNLCVGTYVATVTDNLNCVDSISTNITGPTVLTVLASENSPIACNSNCDGVAIATPLGGNPNYTYLWNDPLNQTTQIATGLCAGTYIVVVTDNNGCSASDTITLGEPSAILANETLTNPNCNQCDGIITLAPTGGVGPYTFVWTTPTSPPNPNTALLNSLCAGAYSVDITDATGCTVTFNFPLSSSNAPLPNTTVTNVSCFGVCDGSISSAATGGTTPYTYLWSPVGGNGSSATNLCAGTYTLNITDALGCIGIAIDSVTEPGILQANITSSNITCAGSCDGTAVANPLGGTAPFTYNWTPGSLIQDSIINLCAGNYIVTITDSNNCIVQDSATIIEPAIITSTNATTPVTCSANCDGSATLTVNGGIGPYTFEWNGNSAPGQTNNQTGLCFGLNTILITDNLGCSILDSINVGATDTVLANAGNDVTICIGNNVDLIGTPGGNFTNVEWFELPGMNSLGISDTTNVSPSVIGVTCYVYQVTGNCIVSDTVCVTTEALPIADAGADVTIIEGNSTTLNGTGGGSYSWTPSSTLSDSTIFNPLATPDSTTTYYLTVTSAGGCISTDSVTVIVIPTVDFPNGITPNGDGQNDVWIIDFIEQYPNNVVEIYNRWGELLFHADGYLQDWDGTYNGKNLPIGTYYYIIDLGDESVKPFTGPITILR
jgi:gliding motility-associated-like protein